MLAGQICALEILTQRARGLKRIEDLLPGSVSSAVSQRRALSESSGIVERRPLLELRSGHK